MVVLPTRVFKGKSGHLCPIHAMKMHIDGRCGSLALTADGGGPDDWNMETGGGM